MLATNLTVLDFEENVCIDADGFDLKDAQVVFAIIKTDCVKPSCIIPENNLDQFACELQASIEELQNTISTLNSTIADLDQKEQNLQDEDQIEALENDVEGLKTDTADLEAKNDEQDSRLDELEQENQEQKDQITALEEENENLKCLLAALQGKVAKIEEFFYPGGQIFIRTGGQRIVKY